MKKYFILIACITFSTQLFSQKYITKEGQIDIFSETSLFTIEATNNKVASILNAETGDVVVSTLVRSFKFHEALVEEHFNENYMESHKYPKSVFKGKITNWNDVDLNTDGTYTIQIEGEHSMHGETRTVNTKGTFTVKNGNVSAKTSFDVSLENYKILVEESYKDRIKDTIKLDIHFNYSKMN